ncbi:MAG: NADH-quinone oxidoreductase subunit J, partial [Alphaproteobacteria bacterium]|nr:NADH-quinone oxidoreductase subunit J [Alphaproteobacteria bacterium]
MMIPSILFYLFATVLVLSSIMVIASRNPVHSVLFLILSFFNAAGLFLLLGAEFAAFILVIVYVGAVAVLFLFVVMMLDIDFEQLRKGVWKSLPVGILVGLVLVSQMVMTAINWQSLPSAGANILSPVATNIAKTNTQMIGQILYTDYVYPFQVAGLILLVAMIGAIVLTLRERGGVLRQDINKQITRKRSDVLVIKKVE